MQNREADLESRVFRETVEWKLPSTTYQHLAKKWGPFLWDLLVFFSFASRLNAKCAKYISWYPDPHAALIDAFVHNWSTIPNWFSFPPFSLIARVISKARRENAQGVFIKCASQG